MYYFRIKKHFSILILSLTLLFVNCTSTKISSYKSSNIKKVLKRIYIIIEMPTIQDLMFKENLSSQLEDKFSRNGIVTKTSLSIGLKSGDENLSEKIDEFNPDAILHLLQTGKTMVNSLQELKFNAFLKTYNENKIIWSANIEIKCDFSFNESVSMSKSLSKKLIKKLREDGLFH